jgi:hypothetical protein
MVKKMKKFIVTILCLLIIGLTILKYQPITDKLVNSIEGNNKLVILPANNYEKKYYESYVQETDNFVPYSKQDILNIIYTIINKGWDKFTFYCPKEYETCVKDVTTISKDDTALTHLNNFVHPYNSFTNLKSSITDTGEITINVNYLYTRDEITKINTKVKSIEKELLNNSMTDYDKIKKIHDYIINNTKYDIERNQSGNSAYSSYIAMGPLFDGYATCNGYTDLMAIFLSDLNYENFKIATTPDETDYSSTGHVWNAVKVNNEWLHLDLTWDDPVSNDGKDYLYHTYFLVTTEEMEKSDSGEVVLKEHKFDKSIYIEMKKDSN